MTLAASARSCLEMLDVDGMRKLSAHVMPHIAAGSDENVLTAMHIARTQCEALAIRYRAYSHRWLEERGLPSQLPDRLKPSVDRLYPKVTSAVGLAISLGPKELKPAADLIRTAMSDEVEDCYASKREDPAYVKPRMDEAGRIERKRLFGAFDKIYAMGSI